MLIKRQQYDRTAFFYLFNARAVVCQPSFKNKLAASQAKALKVAASFGGGPKKKTSCSLLLALLFPSLVAVLYFGALPQLFFCVADKKRVLLHLGPCVPILFRLLQYFGAFVLDYYLCDRKKSFWVVTVTVILT